MAQKIKKIEGDIKSDKLTSEQEGAIKNDPGLLSGEAKEIKDRESLATKITGETNEQKAQRDREARKREIEKADKEGLEGMKETLLKQEQKIRELLGDKFQGIEIKSNNSEDGLESFEMVIKLTNGGSLNFAIRQRENFFGGGYVYNMYKWGVDQNGNEYAYDVWNGKQAYNIIEICSEITEQVEDLLKKSNKIEDPASTENEINEIKEAEPARVEEQILAQEQRIKEGLGDDVFKSMEIETNDDGEIVFKVYLQDGIEISNLIERSEVPGAGRVDVFYRVGSICFYSKSDDKSLSGRMDRQAFIEYSAFLDNEEEIATEEQFFSWIQEGLVDHLRKGYELGLKKKRGAA